MDASQLYVAAGIVVLAAIAILVVTVSKNTGQKGFTPLAGLAFAFVLAGIVLGEERVIGYGLLGVGIVLAVIDIVRKSRSRSVS